MKILFGWSAVNGKRVNVLGPMHSEKKATKLSSPVSESPNTRGGKRKVEDGTNVVAEAPVVKKRRVPSAKKFVGATKEEPEESHKVPEAAKSSGKSQQQATTPYRYAARGSATSSRCLLKKIATVE